MLSTYAINVTNGFVMIVWFCVIRTIYVAENKRENK